MSLPVWLPSPMFLLGASLCLVPCSLLGGLCPGGVSVQEGSLSRGSSLSGGSLSRSLCRETPPPESEKRVVRILLECFVVNNKCLFMVKNNECRYRNRRFRNQQNLLVQVVLIKGRGVCLASLLCKYAVAGTSDINKIN